jgi:molecular chaperone GrpE
MPKKKGAKEQNKTNIPDNQQSITSVDSMNAHEELIQFTSLKKGELKLPTENQLKKFKVPETEVAINETTINLNAKLTGAKASDIMLSLSPDSLVVLCENKKIAYYTEIKLPENIIPQSAVAKFANGNLKMTILKIDGSKIPWEDLEHIEKLQRELKDTKERHTKLQQQYHGIQLDYQNLLVKSKKEIDAKIDTYKISVIEKLLKNIDNFELALESTSKHQNKDNEQIIKGINLFLNELRSIISEENVTEVASEGLLFDPHLHEVLDFEETEKYPENTILEVYQKGYKYKDKVIRPAKVRIATSRKAKKKEKGK